MLERPGSLQRRRPRVPAGAARRGAARIGRTHLRDVTPGGYGPAGRSAWMDVDWREHLRWIDVDGSPVNVVDIGSGPAVVFLHGLAGCWQNWLENIPALARDHRVIALDLPGFGASPMPSTPITMPGYARMLDELFVTLGVDSATLVGSSMGGFVAAEFAIRYGAQVERLCLASPAGLSMEHMRNERNQGLRARIENVLFFGTYWAASKSDRVVRRERLRRALLLLLAAHPEQLPSALDRRAGARRGQARLRRGARRDDRLPDPRPPRRDRLPGARRLGRARPARPAARRRRVRMAHPGRAQGRLRGHRASRDARASRPLQRRSARLPRGAPPVRANPGPACGR